MPIALRGQAAAFGTSLLFLTLGMPGARAETPAATPLAQVNGEPITAAELEHNLATRLSKLEEQIYTLKRDELENLIAQRLLAQEASKRGTSVPALVDAEVTAKVGLVTEQEVEAFYQANKARLRGDNGSVREKIRAHLQQQKLLARRKEFVDTLRAQSKVVVRLQPPSVVRVAVSTDGAPVRGAKEAPVTIVEFSDFHCPFCNRAQPTLKQVLERYPGKVKLVYRDFPLDALHPQARQAAEAARCANDQGKFWEYHDVLYNNAPRGGADDLRRYGEQLVLDMPKFEQCISTGVHRSAVERDVEEGRRLGVTGTPAFFVNGRPLEGAQPLEAFVRLIDEELARKEERSDKK